MKLVRLWHRSFAFKKNPERFVKIVTSLTVFRTPLRATEKSCVQEESRVLNPQGGITPSKTGYDLDGSTFRDIWAGWDLLE